MLPRRATKTYRLERNTQGLIGGPPIWRETWSGRLGEPAKELSDLPPQATTAHEGWTK
ncbi:MAG: hypothetical protein O2894_02640 [Planctomycetota bacterium]|nr:hypothetical protein [Planctomycetota bacterium]